MDFITSSWLFQIANMGLLLSYIAFSILWLRMSLAFASIFFVIWGVTAFEDKIIIDTVLWNIGFASINLAHAAKMIYERRPIVFQPADRRPALEAVYGRLFEPVGMTRLQFRGLTENGGVEFVTVAPGEAYISRGDSCEHVAVIVAGQLQVIAEGGINAARIGEEGIEMIDAVEFAAAQAGLEEGENWSVDMAAPGDSGGPVTVMRWRREELQTRLGAGGPFGPRPMFEAAMGRDVVKTFFTSSRALAREARGEATT